ncbi:MAG: hypothetical protein ACR2PL_19670 [Dehalococcoidia bacterium]
MKTEHLNPADPKIADAVDELTALIRRQYPDASFDTVIGEDPEGVYLRATIDVDDTPAVMDTVIDRLYELEVEVGLPVYVQPVRPSHRVAEILKERRSVSPGTSVSHPLPF